MCFEQNIVSFSFFWLLLLCITKAVFDEGMNVKILSVQFYAHYFSPLFSLHSII